MEKKRLTIFFSVLIVACLFLAAAIVLLVLMPKDSLLQKPKEQPAAESATTQAPTQPVHEKARTATPLEASPTLGKGVAATEQIKTIAPQGLSDALDMGGETLQELSDRGCRQLVTVTSSGSEATIDVYDLQDHEWNKVEELSCSGFVGENGVTDDMHEGAHATPQGLYSIGEAFYLYDAPETGLPTFHITDDTYWVDDPNSKYYNQKVVGTSDMDWSSAEHMIEADPYYRYGFVIDYNTECKRGAGSAIFFHIKTVPTLGCVATQEENVLKILKHLDASQNPHILIV